MPQHGMTVSPVVQEGANGEQVVDFNVSSTSHAHQSNPNEYVQDDYGNTHHVFENVELNEEDTTPDVNADILEGIRMEYPDLSAATKWAEKYDVLSSDQIEAWNNAMQLHQSDGFDAIQSIHDNISVLMEAFNRHGGANPHTGEMEMNFNNSTKQESAPEELVPRSVEYDDETDSPEEVAMFNQMDDSGQIDNTLDLLINGWDFSDDMVSEMAAAIDTNQLNHVEENILRIGLAVYQGDISMEDAIEAITEDYGDVKAATNFYSVLNKIS